MEQQRPVRPRPRGPVAPAAGSVRPQRRAKVVTVAAPGVGRAAIDDIGSAGNRAIAALLRPAAQRQPAEPPAADAPVGEAPLLDARQIAAARRYFTSQPARYTPAIVGQIRSSLGLGVAGGVDDELVLAVAAFQVTLGSGEPALAIDGKAGPRTLPRIFQAGLNEEGEGGTFGSDVQTGVIDEWSTLGTAEERLRRLVELVNLRLEQAGVPPVTPTFDANPNNSGSFHFATWQMEIGRGRLDAASISEDDARETTDTVYHEARHTEQWFRMARLRAGQGLSARAIAVELGIEARIATLAAADPLLRGSMEALVAQGWWDSVYGSGSDHRDAVLTELDRAGTARTRAATRLAANPSPANQAAVDRADARFARAMTAYLNLPEENDAWATAQAAAAGITAGSPAPAPAGAAAGAAGAAGLPGDAGEPAGAPPPGDGPAHGILPEEDLP